MTNLSNKKTRLPYTVYFDEPTQLVFLPLHKQISDQIRNTIRSGQYAPGSKIPTEMEFVEKYNVSRITVRRAFQELMSEGLIKGRKRHGTFVCLNAPYLATKRYLFVHSQISTTYPYIQKILGGIQSLNPNLEFRLELFSIPFRQDREANSTNVFDLIEACKFNGAIVLSGLLNHHEIRSISSAKIPLVSIGREKLDNSIYTTQVDSGPERILPILLRHLKERGRKTVGIIGRPDEEDKEGAADRKQISSFMKESGLTYDYQLYEPSGWGIQPGSEACKKLLERCPNLDAIVATDDLQAIGVLKTLRSLDKRVPQDIAVTGVGNYLDSESHKEHDITTIDCQLFEQGRMAAECLNKKIAGEKVKSTIWIAPKLIKRQTS